MKIIFEKGENGDINIKIKNGDITESFDYIKMIKALGNKELLEEPEFNDALKEEEQVKVKEMINKINETIVLTREEKVG